jgi:hypothetical protein
LTNLDFLDNIDNDELGELNIMNNPLNSLEGVRRYINRKETLAYGGVYTNVRPRPTWLPQNEWDGMRHEGVAYEVHNAFKDKYEAMKETMEGVLNYLRENDIVYNEALMRQAPSDHAYSDKPRLYIIFNHLNELLDSLLPQWEKFGIGETGWTKDRFEAEKLARLCAVSPPETRDEETSECDQSQ